MQSTSTEMRSLTDAELDAVGGGGLGDTLTGVVDAAVNTVTGIVGGATDVDLPSDQDSATVTIDATVTVFGTKIPVPGLEVGI
ncbi:hypothetical protein [Paracoccus alkanivorans]|uniref:Uncharacterized protein n=1 Tax=Paracoccus alkanivorans TaxID=2116655 RepID=A0A3M0M9G2_9RHOB|nr:hypothetical protein [Paracoccus alkanivorans]RMC34438.1 hypothetical protein C9E81_14980 [Paracoccus alkanivorans]